MVYYTLGSENLIADIVAFGFLVFAVFGFFYVLLLVFLKSTGRVKRVVSVQKAENKSGKKSDFGRGYGGSFGVKFGTFGGIKWWQKW